MAVFFYNIFLLFYKTGIRIAALWNVKARKWLDGRKNIFGKIRSEVKIYNSDNIWVHCSSLGEFEQGRPVIENFKRKYPAANIVLTFFSPSGFEIRKNYGGAAWVFYLPMDSRANAKEFIDMIRPQLAIFIKYDYWYYYLAECKKQNIPLLMVSAIFRKEQAFFKWYGTLHRKMLACFDHFFVQDKESYELLSAVDIKNVTVSGDTRFDRVAEIAENFKPIKAIESFCGDSPILVAGSTWPSDEQIIKEALARLSNLKIIIAPHEIHEEHLRQLIQIFPKAVLYSQLSEGVLSDTTPVRTGTGGHHSPSACLIIDNIGMLSSLYHYATITYIGGGFDKGIHNTLEAAVYGKPVFFGPNYRKFKEAIQLIAAGGGISVNSTNELQIHVEDLLTNRARLDNMGKNSFDYVQQNKGATEKIMNIIQENRRFTK